MIFLWWSIGHPNVHFRSISRLHGNEIEPILHTFRFCISLGLVLDVYLRNSKDSNRRRWHAVFCGRVESVLISWRMYVWVCVGENLVSVPSVTVHWIPVVVSNVRYRYWYRSLMYVHGLHDCGKLRHDEYIVKCIHTRRHNMSITFPKPLTI